MRRDILSALGVMILRVTLLLVKNISPEFLQLFTPIMKYLEQSRFP